MWYDSDPAFMKDQREVLGLLGVEVEKRGGRLITKWTVGQARAFQLVHVLLHEFGHHHDRMTTRWKEDVAPRGEGFAEEYARRYESRIWTDYIQRFDI